MFVPHPERGGEGGSSPSLKVSTSKARNTAAWLSDGDMPIGLRGSTSKGKNSSPTNSDGEGSSVATPSKGSRSKASASSSEQGTPVGTPLPLARSHTKLRTDSATASPIPLRVSTHKGRNSGDRKVPEVPVIFDVIPKKSVDGKDDSVEEPPLVWHKETAMVHWARDSWSGSFVFEKEREREGLEREDSKTNLGKPTELKTSWRGRLRRRSTEMSAPLLSEGSSENTTPTSSPSVSRRNVAKKRRRKSGEPASDDSSKDKQVVPDMKQGILFNFRDLSAATDVAGEGLIDGAIFRSGCLSRGYVNEKDVKAALHFVSNVMGISTIIDLRTKEEKTTDHFDDLVEMVYPTLGYQPTERMRKRFNVCFVNKDFKMKGVFWHASTKSTKVKMVSSVFNRDKRVKCAGEGALNPLGLAGVNKLMLLYAYEEIASAFRIVGNPDNHPILIHCASGKDRTGLICALILACCGVNEEDIIENYHVSEKHLSSVMPLIINENRVKGLNRLFDGTPKSVMVDTFEFIKEKWGSVHDYLDDIGFSYEEQQQLIYLLAKEPERVCIENVNKSRGEIRSSLKQIEKNVELKKTKHHNQKMTRMMEEAQQEFKILGLEKTLALAQAKNDKYVQIIAHQSIEIEELRRALALYESGQKPEEVVDHQGEGEESGDAKSDTTRPEGFNPTPRRATLDFFSMMAGGYFAASGEDKTSSEPEEETLSSPRSKRKKKKSTKSSSRKDMSPRRLKIERSYSQDATSSSSSLANPKKENGTDTENDTETETEGDLETSGEKESLDRLAFQAFQDAMSQSGNTDFYEMLRNGYDTAFGVKGTSTGGGSAPGDTNGDKQNKRITIRASNSKGDLLEELVGSDEEDAVLLEETQKEILAEKIRLRAERHGTVRLFSMMGGGFNAMNENFGEGDATPGEGRLPLPNRIGKSDRDALLDSASARVEGEQGQFPVLLRADPRKKKDATTNF